MFEILEHTADIGFRARGKTLPELFVSAAEALVAITMSVERARPDEPVELRAEGDSLESLLVNWLSEVLYQVDGEGRALSTFRIREFSESRLVAEAAGERRDPVRHEARLVVKGVTYHQLKIQQDGGAWCCEVYLDI